MAVFHDIHQLPEFKNAVLTIGFFDGVHKGHKVILNEVCKHAGQMNATSVLLTFEPHPRKLLYPDQPLGIITPLHKKLELIEAAGIENIVVVPFTRQFSQLTAEEYIRNFMVGLFQPGSIVIGYDHRFGHDRKGNIDLMKQYAPIYNYSLTEIPAQLIDEAAVSSTKIRNALQSGMVADAAQMLGRNYTFTGKVVHGQQLGRTIGYPTANIEPDDRDQIIPGLGIYAVRVSHKGHQHNGMMSIGYNPTVTDQKIVRIEANIFDFNKDIYGETIEITMVQKLRDEQKFSSLDALKSQLHQDKLDTLRVLGKELG